MLTLASVVVASAVTVVWTCWVVESCSEVAVAATVVIGIPFNQIATVNVVNQFVFVHKGRRVLQTQGLFHDGEKSEMIKNYTTWDSTYSLAPSLLFAELLLSLVCLLLRWLLCPVKSWLRLSTSSVFVCL